MSLTYAEEIIANLNHLRTVAALHPRLAMVGVESELENLLLETLPPTLQEHLKNEWLYKGSNRTTPYMSTVVRDELANLSEWPDLTPSQKEFLGQLSDRVGKCRHGRPEVTYQEVEQSIDLAIQVVEALKTREYDVPCPRCRLLDTRFSLRQVLDAEVGSVIRLHCDSCGPNAFTYELPDYVNEWELPEEIDVAVKPLTYMVGYLVDVMDMTDRSEVSLKCSGRRVLRVRLEDRTEQKEPGGKAHPA